MQIKAYARSVIGSREKNQDSYLVLDERKLYAVADGVGGGVGGEVASAMAMEGLEEIAKTGDDLRQAVVTSQERILAKAMHDHGAPVMGTTVTGILVEGNTVRLCHVGDSRCYLFQGTHLELKTEDHEFFDESLGATVLGSYLGIPTEEHPLNILQDTFPLNDGDRLMLCSDGLYRQIEEPRLVEILKEFEQEPDTLVEKMCEEASEHPHSDNITVVYLVAHAEDGDDKKEEVETKPKE